MIKLSEKYEIDRKILKCVYIRFIPSESSTINTPISQLYIIIPREYSVISLLNSYLELNFDVLQAVTGNRYVGGADIGLANLAVIAFFSSYELTTSSGKHSEEINHAHIVVLMYNYLSSTKESDDLSIGFDRSRDRRKREVTNNKNIRGKYHLRIYLEIFLDLPNTKKQQLMIWVTN